EGRAEGEAIGIEKIAINMIKANKPLDEIGLFTGLSHTTLAMLREKYK
ncbi:MAG: flagellar assembly protein H, partial [Legionella sp.]|nr:flagellar assembly protein H [Legionella sp.]